MDQMLTAYLGSVHFFQSCNDSLAGKESLFKRMISRLYILKRVVEKHELTIRHYGKMGLDRLEGIHE